MSPQLQRDYRLFEYLEKRLNLEQIVIFQQSPKRTYSFANAEKVIGFSFGQGADTQEEFHVTQIQESLLSTAKIDRKKLSLSKMYGNTVSSGGVIKRYLVLSQ
jgi:hypothetical protein